MVVLEHVLVCLQIEVCIILRILAEADCTVLVHNSSNFNDVSGAQFAVVLVANNLDLLAYARIVS